jgi:hypothetical protein
MVHYPSAIKYELEQSCLALEITMKAISSCSKMKAELVFAPDGKADKMLRILDAMFTFLDTRQALLEVRISELRARQILVNAFNVNVGDSMPSLNDAINSIDKAIADLADPQIISGAK